MRVTSCNLLPGSSVMTIAPVKYEAQFRMQSEGLTVNEEPLRRSQSFFFFFPF